MDFQACHIVGLTQGMDDHQVKQLRGIFTLEVKGIKIGAGIYRPSVKTKANHRQKTTGHLLPADHINHHPPAITRRVWAISLHQRVLIRWQTAVQVQGNEILIDNRHIVVKLRNGTPYPTAG